ncbi:hypothetical protein E2C01_053112 [Portunus trituberculatus]|uniref:Uncharacterized protein n=1 Tax=Portunus trituberculatus TaxID=210409 RepID=A0A5B7GPG2_PORTR|nr:hypothetical protein [Portunus trituberculatus]
MDEQRSSRQHLHEINGSCSPALPLVLLLRMLLFSQPSTLFVLPASHATLRTSSQLPFPFTPNTSHSLGTG